MGTITPLLIEQHIHGAFGYDFNKADAKSVLFVASELLKHGIGYFFPTLVTDSIDNIKKQIAVIKEAAKSCNRIAGIHLEGIFINPAKKGIHNSDYFLPLTVENYKLIEDDFIKIITLAPELDDGLINYLSDKGIKVQAGHCVGGNLSKVNGTTHTFNAMSGISHREQSTTLSALINDNLYSEIIADGVHVSDDAIKLLFKSKPDDKIILVSDALPITYSSLKETVFADSKIYYDGIRATSKEGTIAGSTTLLDKIIPLLQSKGMMKLQYIENPYIYHDLHSNGEILWNDCMNIEKISYEGREV